jgi:hypothetical protein
VRDLVARMCSKSFFAVDLPRYRERYCAEVVSSTSFALLVVVLDPFRISPSLSLLLKVERFVGPGVIDTLPSGSPF